MQKYHATMLELRNAMIKFKITDRKHQEDPFSILSNTNDNILYLLMSVRMILK